MAPHIAYRIDAHQPLHEAPLPTRTLETIVSGGCPTGVFIALDSEIARDVLGPRRSVLVRGIREQSAEPREISVADEFGGGDASGSKHLAIRGTNCFQRLPELMGTGIFAMAVRRTWSHSIHHPFNR